MACIIARINSQQKSKRREKKVTDFSDGQPFGKHHTGRDKWLKAQFDICGTWGDMAQEVRAVVWQSEGCRFNPTLSVSKCPWARHLTPNCSWRAGWYLAWQPIAVGVWMVWMRGINCTAFWIKTLYKCSPFTIYLQVTTADPGEYSTFLKSRPDIMELEAIHTVAQLCQQYKWGTRLRAWAGAKGVRSGRGKRALRFLPRLQGPLPHRAPLLRPAAGGHSGRSTGRRPSHGGDHPPLPDPLSWGHTPQGHSVQVLPAHQRAGQSGYVRQTSHKLSSCQEQPVFKKYA